MSPKPSRREREAAHIPGIVIAYIHPGEVSAYFLESMHTTHLADIAGPRRIVNVLQEWSSANVSAARNTVTSRFLDTRTADGRTVGDWLLWVDADMQWEPDAIELLMQSADPVKRPIVGGLCFGMALEEQVPTIYQWGQTDDGELTTYRVGHYTRDAVVQVAATGAAFLLIHRSVLEAMRAAEFNPAFPFFQELQMGSPGRSVRTWRSASAPANWATRCMWTPGRRSGTTSPGCSPRPPTWRNRRPHCPSTTGW